MLRGVSGWICEHAQTVDKTFRCAVLLQYLGQWYEAERYFALFEFAGKCVSANYTDMGDGRVNIVNRQMSSL
jgi:lipocalin